jgi:hypothetical protein
MLFQFTRDSNDIILDYFGLPPGRFALQFRNIRAKDLLSNFNILGSKITVPDSSNMEDMLEIFNSRGTHQVIDSSGKLGTLILTFCITQTFSLTVETRRLVASLCIVCCFCRRAWLAAIYGAWGLKAYNPPGVASNLKVVPSVLWMTKASSTSESYTTQRTVGSLRTLQKAIMLAIEVGS